MGTEIATRNPGGVFAVSRRLFNPSDPFFGGEPFSRREAWVWLLSEASFKPRTVHVTVGRSRIAVPLERGELAHSRPFMEQAWKWSPKQVRTFLDKLESDGRIERKGRQNGQKYVVLSVCKYSEYQFGEADDGQTMGRQRADERAGERADENGTPKHTVTNSNHGTFPLLLGYEGDEKGRRKGPTKGPQLEEGSKNVRSIARSGQDGFGEWYSAYGKKVQPKDAAKAYARVIASGEISEALLLERTKAFAAKWANEPKERRQFMPYPASWLNKGGYASETDGDGGQPVPVVNPTAFTDDQWRKRLDYASAADKWLDAWGPKPGAPGCLVPSHLLLSPVANKGAA